ncbi:Beta-galactosidase [Thalictrum thalictroides]|uniref:Beta-galactosidase n=1 Tax=Thalictrum thalictroides TaxID=46969 RepID=A0A7J6W770_THATH|nr:Beta-galactosidase [Thalictrum thalictroides]
MAEIWTKTASIVFFFFLLLTAVSLGDHFPSLAPLSESSFDLQNSVIRSPTFDIADDKFWKDGQPFQIIGGDLHYFRVVPEYWEDRLLRAKALGLNTIQTYVPWNLHEPAAGKWVFEGIADLESFLKTCHKLGFLVMLRPGPYICAEWDFGGFPAWMLSIEPALRLRSSDPAFLELVEKWWGILLPKVASLLYRNGGPIIMVQIENEFGSYADDKIYLHHLLALARKHLGSDTILYTTDGGSRDTLEKGTISGANVFAAVDFSTGDDPWPIFKLQQEFNAPGRSPPLSAEFYTGWLTHWGEKIAKTDAAVAANFLESILSQNGSAVLYMAHGGTNFGFLNGANTGADDSDYKADLTSYDYDAPIKESGDVDNAKFKALRRVIKRYSSVSVPSVPSNNERRVYGKIKVQKVASLFDAMDILCDPLDVIESGNPLPMESVGQMFGLLLYVSEYSAKEKGILSIPKVHDRAQVFISCTSEDYRRNPVYVGTIERWSNLALEIPRIACVSNIRLSVLVENMGRLNYGSYIYDRKGILSDVILDGKVLYGWKMLPISLQNLNNISKVNPIAQFSDFVVAKSFSLITSTMPGFYKGSFKIDTINQVNDTYLSFNGWSKGIAFVNDFNLGRFWPLRGPQCNLYVPAPILRQGENIVVILELETPNIELVVSSVDQPDYTCGSELRQL